MAAALEALLPPELARALQRGAKAPPTKRVTKAGLEHAGQRRLAPFAEDAHERAEFDGQQDLLALLAGEPCEGNER